MWICLPLTELQAQVDRLIKERDLALQDASDLRDGLDDLQQMFDEDRLKLQEKFKKEIRAKERQIECLEEQLRSSTNNELRKLKRGISTRQVYYEKHPNDSTTSSVLVDRDRTLLMTSYVVPSCDRT